MSRFDGMAKLPARDLFESLDLRGGKTLAMIEFAFARMIEALVTGGEVNLAAAESRLAVLEAAAERAAGVIEAVANGVGDYPGRPRLRAEAAALRAALTKEPAK